ncbi:MAG: polysaccharide deacetylase family protein [Actinomycetota bacterium]|nr:polysaccharide deacetylase family protein [Actinomycetota bacterium]
MSAPGDSRDPDVRRRRAVALAALGAAVLLLLLAVLFAFAGGDDGGSKRAANRPSHGGKAPAPKRSQAPPPVPGGHKDPLAAVPVFMYHVINAPKPGTPSPELWVSRSDFQAQMKYLADHGYHGVTLQQVWDAWHKGGLLPPKPVVVSFDDGYHSHLTNAMPVLRSHGWPGVENLEVNQTQQDLKPADVRQLIAAGWEIDAHTISHPDLTTLSGVQLEQEVAGSRKQIQAQFGVPVSFFCYPAGRYDAKVIAAVKAAGFLGATTTQLGLARPAQDPYALPRVRVNGSDGVDGLARQLAAVEGGAGGGSQGGE